MFVTWKINIVNICLLELPYDQAIPVLGICHKKNKNTNLKRYIPLNVCSSITYTIAKIWNKPMSRASQVVPIVKNLPANSEDITDVGWILSLGRSLEKVMATLSILLPWRIPMDSRDGRGIVHGVAKSRMHLSTHACTHINKRSIDC